MLSLRRPLFDGTTAVAFTPTELLKAGGVGPRAEATPGEEFRGLRAERRCEGQVIRESALFQEDTLQCASCEGRRKVTTFIPSDRLARQILEKLGVNATGPPIAKARARPRQERFDLHPDDSGVDPQYPD